MRKRNRVTYKTSFHPCAARAGLQERKNIRALRQANPDFCLNEHDASSGSIDDDTMQYAAALANAYENDSVVDRLGSLIADVLGRRRQLV
jgi:hypothetical protein